MKRIIIIYTGVMFALIIGLSGCYKDIIRPELASGPDDFPAQQVSFQYDLAPIFNASCATVGCHSGTQAPNLTTVASYSQIITGNFVNLLNPKESKIYKLIKGDMAQYMPAPVKINTQKVYDWIRNGAPNN